MIHRPMITSDFLNGDLKVNLTLESEKKTPSKPGMCPICNVKNEATVPFYYPTWQASSLLTTFV